ncbi:MAG TPA: DUF3717 domain-containing protein [Limnobacter sp.]|nr:DUF3717 domain-containing protein [Limnobacter sp.]
MSNTTLHTVSIIELEQAINYWRSQHPSSRDTMILCPQAAILAELYAHMIIFHQQEIPLSDFPEKAAIAFQQAHKN